MVLELDYDVKANAIRIKVDDKNYAYVKFHIEGKKIFLDSTYTPEEHRGKGVGGELMKASMDYAEKNGLFIVPVCAFATEYFKKHPQYDRLLSKG